MSGFEFSYIFIYFFFFFRRFGKFFLFFKILVFLKNYSANFQKESAHSLMCLCTHLVSFYLTPLSTAFKKVYEGIFDLYIFLHFLKNYPLKSEILVSMDRTGCGKLSCISFYDQIFYTSLYGS